MFGNVTWEPVVGANHGFSDEVFVGGIDGLIESHVDIGANFPLGLHGNLGIHADFVAVNMGFESNAIVVDFSVCEGKHLEAARVSKSWTVPASKFGKSASLFDKVWARSKNKMVGIGEDALRA